jgi:two-component system, OmpR family, KDP operon response regulator KdpE
VNDQGLRLLIVDDHDMSRSLLHAIIDRSQHPRLRGIRTADATTLAEARAAIAAAPFDVVLLDVHLPDGSGLDLLADIATMPPPRPVVIALTGGVLPHQRAAAIEAGCDAFLDKPFLADDLTNLLDKLVPPPPP